jgi:hypothetical protein
MNHATSRLSLQQWFINNESICSIDPLAFDNKLPILHQLNRDKDIPGLIRFLYRLLPYPAVLENYGYEESIAAMRDLGIVIGTLKRNGVEPVEVVPELEYVLLVLMVKTNLPPRDTLIHYTVWNPSGARQRTYTGLADEIALIESVKMSYPALMEAIIELASLHEHPLFGEEFVTACAQIRGKMEGMVRAIVHAKKNVSPAVFANELRFYFDPIKVDYNKEYIGPGAVEMPMFVFDHLLWSCDCKDATYVSFKEGYLPYNLQFISEIYRLFDGQDSLVTKVFNALKQQPDEERFQAAQAVLDLCTVLKSFRMPHKKMAEESYSDNDGSHREKGSGGYTVNILHHILHLQNEKIAKLQSVVHERQMASVNR